VGWQSSTPFPGSWLTSNPTSSTVRLNKVLSLHANPAPVLFLGTNSSTSFPRRSTETPSDPARLKTGRTARTDTAESGPKIVYCGKARRGIAPTLENERRATGNAADVVAVAVAVAVAVVVVGGDDDDGRLGDDDSAGPAAHDE
jgi:hypothetical protein